ncbi:MAG TPA: esterase/lipase family protein [Elainellaceae cyanobacterium]
MQDYTLIIHGWSDCSNSFELLKTFLQTRGIGNVETILYVDYESREDSLTFNDIVDGFYEQLKQRQLIDDTGKKLCNLNVVVHSTGGLVMRHWIWRYYRDRLSDCPLKRLIMLAPANFGSPLAHRGKSFLGRLVKGRWKVGDFLEIGKQLLDGLELASLYQWELAHRDLLVESPYYNASQIQLTILVGIEDYTGIMGWVNKPGTDGAVVIAGTPLNSVKIMLDFSQKDYGDPVIFDWKEAHPPDDFAFGILKGLNHGSIIDATFEPEHMASQTLLRALKTQTEQDFRELQNALTVQTELTYDDNPDQSKYQQFILHAIDDQDADVIDYTLEFAISRSDTNRFLPKRLWSKDEQTLSRDIQELIASEFHTYGRNSSYRRFLVNVSELKQFLKQAKERLRAEVKISIEIYIPEIERGIRYDTRNLTNVIVFDSSQKTPNLPDFFYENTTTLVELRVNRFNQYVTVDSQSKRQRTRNRNDREDD